MRITKVYTRGGDKGLTSLVGGERVPKNHPRINAYGTVDELNATIGLVRTFNRRSEADPASVATLDAMLNKVQNDLFNLGADLATPTDSRWEGIVLVSDDDVTGMEAWIDQLNDELGPLREFILPGGGPVGAFFHQARTVCRRAEREVLGLMESDPEVDSRALRYLNRLSDWLFVAGRWAAKALGEPELFWERPARPATR